MRFWNLNFLYYAEYMAWIDPEFKNDSKSELDKSIKWENKPT